MAKKRIINSSPRNSDQDTCSREDVSKFYKTVTNNGKKQYQCYICNKNYQSTIGAKSHYISKHTTRFQCNFKDCSKCFSSQRLLINHQPTHTNQRPFVCSVTGCKQSYLQKRYLTVHMRTHTQVKNHTNAYVYFFLENGLTNRKNRKF